MGATLPCLPSPGIPDFSAFIVELSIAFFLRLTWQCLYTMSRDGWSSVGKLGSMSQSWVEGSVFPWAKLLVCLFPYCSLLSWRFSMVSSPLILVQQRLMLMLCMREEVSVGTGKELFNKKVIIDQWLQSVKGHLLIHLSLWVRPSVLMT